MGRSHVLLGFTLSLLLCLTAIPASAIEVIEAWRGGGFSDPFAASVNPTDGSCWVADLYSYQVVHLAEDGTELWRGEGFGFARSVSVNPADGSCWAAGGDDAGWVVHLAEDGTELWRGEESDAARSVSVNPTDGSCWVAGGVDEAGWVAHLAEDGTELWRGGGFDHPQSISVNPTDGSCWVAVMRDHQVVHLAEDGTELWRGGGFDWAQSVSVNPVDGSCWVGYYCTSGPGSGQDYVSHLAADGTELWRRGGFDAPDSVSVNPADGSCWVGNGAAWEVVLFAEDGTELWRGGDFVEPLGVSANSADGSCWAVEFDPGRVVHLAILGWQPSIFYDVPWYFWAFDETGACYEAGIVGGYGDGLYHPELTVTRDQMAVYVARALVAPSGEAGLAEYVPADPRNFPDAADTGYGDDGTEPYWAYKHIEYCVENGVVQGYLDGLYHPAEEVNRAQMAVYIARALVAPSGEAALADYVPADPRNFPDAADTGYGDDGTDPYWAYTHIEYCVEHGVVQGYLDGLYHPDEIVTRAQMAVYVARAFGLTS